MIKSTFLAIMMLTSFNLFSQTPLRQPDYNVNNAKSTNALQITPIHNLSAVANYLSGPGVTISNLKFNGSSSTIIGNMIGSYEFTGGTPAFGIDTGIIISSGGVTGAVGPNNSGSVTTVTGMTTQIVDPQLQALVPLKTIVESAVLEFDFVPLTDTVIACKFVFGSEEYPEFVNTNYNDVFGFFISGPNPLGGTFVSHNLALIPGSTIPISIDNLNALINSQYYIDNSGGQTLQYDGNTIPIMLQQAVTPGQLYHFKIAVADAGDASYDSGVFMKIKSFYGYASMPVANFSSSINGNAVTFENTTDYAKYFVWDFGDDVTDTVYPDNNTITHVYNNNGSYDVKLEAHNFYQVNTIVKAVQIGNSQDISEINGNKFELIPLTADTYQLNISLQQPEDVSLRITDISGKPVRTMFLKAQKEISHTLRLSGLAKGVYILQVNALENVFVRKVINK
jgi:hypothetical protein